MFDNSLLRFRKDIKYLTFDVESWNLCLNFCFNRFWQIGLIQSNGFNIYNKQEIIINWLKEKPDLLIEPEVAAKTHFSKEKLQKYGLDPKEAFNIFWPIFNETEFIVCHNGLGFDLYLLKEYCLYMGKEWKFLYNKVIDTNALAKGIKDNIPFDAKKESFLEYQLRMSNHVKKGLKTNLGQSCKDYGIEYIPEQAHDGIYDALKTLEIWEKMVWRIEI